MLEVAKVRNALVLFVAAVLIAFPAGGSARTLGGGHVLPSGIEVYRTEVVVNGVEVGIRVVEVPDSFKSMESLYESRVRAGSLEIWDMEYEHFLGEFVRTYLARGAQHDAYIVLFGVEPDAPGHVATVLSEPGRDLLAERDPQQWIGVELPRHPRTTETFWLYVEDQSAFYSVHTVVGSQSSVFEHYEQEMLAGGWERLDGWSSPSYQDYGMRNALFAGLGGHCQLSAFSGSAPGEVSIMIMLYDDSEDYW